ncbi:unnamed protein product [Lampetra planeri]
MRMLGEERRQSTSHAQPWHSYGHGKKVKGRTRWQPEEEEWARSGVDRSGGLWDRGESIWRTSRTHLRHRLDALDAPPPPPRLGADGRDAEPPGDGFRFARSLHGEAGLLAAWEEKK